MKSLVNDIAKGYWAMTFEGLNFWGPIANKIMNRETVEIKVEPGALLAVFDKDNRRVPEDEDGNMEVPPGSVAVIDVVGPLIRYGDWCTYGSEEIVAALQRVENNPNFIGAVVWFDGPGGGVTAIPPFIAFGHKKLKPYVGLYEQCCSAHLYAMYSFCDHVMAENDLSATIGSCGIVFSFMDNREYLENLGFKLHEIYPDESKDKNMAFRLALEGKYDMIKKEMLSPLAIKFQDACAAVRPKLRDVPGALTGKTFFTDQAISIGMADSKGSLEDAIERVRIQSELKLLRK